MRLEGRWVLISGASSGLGRQLALGAARRGAHLLLLGRDREALAETEGACRAAGALQVRWGSLDLRDGQALRAFLAGVGELDLLVNNAGCGAYGPAAGTEEVVLRELLDVNLISVVGLVQACLPHMGRGARILTVASAAAIRGVPFLAAYAASKAALVAYMEALGAELRARGIGVSVALPGYIDTPFFEREHRVPGARRPAGPYLPAEYVAERILRGVERDRSRILVSREAWAMELLRRLWPSFLDRVLARMADRLRTGSAG